MQTLKLTALFLVLVMTFGCTKDDEPAVPTKTQLISRNWQIQTLIITLGTTAIPAYTRGNNQNVINLDAYRLNFKADGTYSQTNSDGTVDSNYTWAFLPNETGFSLIAQPSQYTVQWMLDDLTAQTLGFSRKIAPASTDPSDLYYLDLLKSAGLPTSAGATLTIKAMPAS